MSTSSSHQSSIEDCGARTSLLDTKKYMLIKDCLAKTKRGVNSTGKLKLISRHEEQRVLKGSLWEQRETHSPNHSLSSFSSAGSKNTIPSKSGNQALNNSSASNSSHTRKVELDSIEYDEVRLITQEVNISELSEQQCRLLLAVPDCDERYKVHLDQEHMSTATLINVHSRVIVSTRKLEPCKGIVRWKGRLAGKQGISFGVEIQDPTKHGSGDSDGSFNSVRLFTCEANNGVFVNISNLKLIPPQRPDRKARRPAASATSHRVSNGNKSSDVSRSSDISSIEEEGEGTGGESQAEQLELYPVTDPQINDRVVWIGESGYERATIKWIGCLPTDDSSTQQKEILVGVEFDNPVGKGTGFYQKKRLFHAQKGHASLVPLVGLYNDPHDDPPPSYHTPSPPPQFGKPVTAAGKLVTAAGKPVTATGKPVTAAGGLMAASSCMIEENNADDILRDLAIDSAAIDSVDNTTQNTHGASYKTATTNDINHSKPRPPLPNKADRLPSGLVVSPTHTLQNGQGVKCRQAKSSNCEALTGVCETSIDSCGTSSNDSLSNPSKTSPRRTVYPPTVSLSPSHIRASNSKTKAPIPGSTQGGCSLLVPVSNHRPSSIGSISPRSCDGSSQGSDSHSSPSRSNHSPLYPPNNHYEPQANYNNNANRNHKQSPNYNIPHTSPSRRRTKIRQDVKTSPQHRGDGGGGDKDLIMSMSEADMYISRVCRETPRGSDVGEGTAVSVDNQPGTVKWIGYELSKTGRYFAGVKMREPNDSCSNGWYGDERLVKSSTNDIMFVNLRKCEVLNPSENRNNNVHSSPSKVSSPTRNIVSIEGMVTPSSADYDCSTHLVGSWRGIQGDRNSCYMDASIYAMFSFSCVFDKLLLTSSLSASAHIPNLCDIQRVLRCNIVNPLRKNGLVVKDAMHRLRKLLDDLGMVKGLRREEKDPEEFINLVLDNVFKVPPSLQLSNGQSCHTFHLLAEKDARIAFPTVQQLLEHSCAQEQLKFKQAPSYLLLHMPRFGKDFRMYDKILPTLELDITDILEGAARSCYVCGEQALWECPECYASENEWKKSTFCHDCSNTVHRHDKRAGHMPINLRLLEEMDGGGDSQLLYAPVSMKLYSVICIDTSHYVTFTRTSLEDDSKWLFFDSMAHRREDKIIPAVYPVDDLTYWLSKAGFESIAKDFEAVPSNIKRIVSDGYIYFYCLSQS